jgi:hypothetical protein
MANVAARADRKRVLVGNRADVLAAGDEGPDRRVDGVAVQAVPVAAPPLSQCIRAVTSTPHGPAQAGSQATCTDSDDQDAGQAADQQIG